MKPPKVDLPFSFPFSLTDNSLDALSDDPSTDAASLNKRRKQGLVLGRQQIGGMLAFTLSLFQANNRPGSASRSTLSRSGKHAAGTTRTGRGHSNPSQDQEVTSDDDEDPEYAPTSNSSLLSDPPFSEPEATQLSASTRVQPQQTFVIPPKSQLAQREEDEAKAARKNQKKKAQKTLSAKSQEPLGIQNRFQLKAEIDGKEAAAAGAKRKRTTGAAATRELEKQQKAAELEALQAMEIPAPLPYTLQLPALPRRHNHTGRKMRLKLIRPDPTFPLTLAQREHYVAVLMDAVRDCTIAQDKVALTTNYWHVWLKQIKAGTYTYKEIDMERVCRKLVNIAEGLHIHGLGSTDIYCPETIKKAMAAKPMLFGDRIGKLAILMRKTKARCNEFMLGNTLEDTVALIDLKVSDQKSNNANNWMRSVRVEEGNKYFKVSKGTKWPKDENGHPLRDDAALAALGHDNPENIMAGNVKDEHDKFDDREDWQPAEDVQQVSPPEPGFEQRQQPPPSQKQLLPWLTDEDMALLSLPPSVRDNLQHHGPKVDEARGDTWQPPADLQRSPPIDPTLMDPTLSPFDGSYVSSIPSKFDNSSIGSGQQTGPQIGMLPPPPYGSPSASADLWDMSQEPQTVPAYYAVPEAQLGFVAGRAEQELFEARLLREREHRTFEPNRVTRTAKDKASRQIGDEQGGEFA